MGEHKEDELHKEKFQLERIALFSDAVFAIAITLLIIEIKVPEINRNELSDHELWNGLIESIPKLIGFFISFFVIGLYWLSHHRLFKYVIRSSEKLVWNNLLFLLPIIVMPFSTSFLSEYYNGALRLPLAVYMINICFTGFLSYRLWRIVGNSKYHLSKNLDKVIVSYNSTRALTTPIIFIFLFLLSFFKGWLSYIFIPFLPVVSNLIKRYYFRKHPEIMKKHME